MQTRNPNNIRLIDVSHHQGVIDWPKVAADGIKGAFIKATEGVGYTDPRFLQNAKGAAAAGLQVGFYHYCRPETGNTPAAEAEWFAKSVKGLSAALPYVLDVEGAASNLGGAKLTQWVQQWLSEVERLTEHRVMIYTGASFAKTYLGKELAKWPLWIAHYGVNQPMSNPTWERWSVFQYASNGAVNGIKGNVDMNEMEVSFWEECTKPKPVDKPVDNPVDKSAAEKVIAVLGALWTASADKQVQEAAHFAANALRDAAGIPRQ
ncbi:glycoside hydrolase family 25 protein [Brevibacillus borstelensis]|uniref:glycoside hydrolase family 25 protein n=1 Tax=Brevibacillus borstelensis TaxID=45462 RepID=UPI002E24B8B7|nr:glycoside hydrolase family 25 protein [Brevibacillus borstelensis]